MNTALSAPQFWRCHTVDIPTILFTIQNWIGLVFLMICNLLLSGGGREDGCG